MSDVSPLQVKMGIGYGKCALLYVGGIFNRSEFFTVGEGLEWALGSEGEATGGGQVIVAEPAWNLVKDKYYSKKRTATDKDGKKYYEVDKLVGKGIKPGADALGIMKNIKEQDLMRMREALESCVPAAIKDYLNIGAEALGSENRSLTVMFCSLGIELSSSAQAEGRNKIQKMVETVQKMVYRHQGSVNKLLMDDKGSTLICLWGLTPLAHEDDAARAITCAYNMRKAIMEVCGAYSCFGISSGEVFSGIAGTIGSRKEFTCLGDVANLGARIMAWPMYKKIRGKIFVEANTKTQASNAYNFYYHGHQEFKGKSISTGVFEPIFNVPGDRAYVLTPELSPGEPDYDPKRHPRPKTFEERKKEVEVTQRDRFDPLDTMDWHLKVHMNPLVMDQGLDLDVSKNKAKKDLEMLGCDTKLRNLSKSVIQYFNEDYVSLNKSFFVSIRGEIGAGKTMFGRSIIHLLTKNKRDFKYFKKDASGPIPIFFSSLDSESAYNFLNIWQPVLQQMMSFLCDRDNLKDEAILMFLVSSNKKNFDKWDILCKMFNISNGLKCECPVPNIIQSVEKVGNPFNYFVSPQSFQKQVEIDLELFILEFVKLVIGQYDDLDSEMFSQYKICYKNNNGGRDFQETSINDQPPFIISLDTINMLSAQSWDFMVKLIKTCKRLALVLQSQTDSQDKVRCKDPQAEEAYTALKNSDACADMLILDLPNLDQDLFRNLLLQLSKQYRSSFMAEIMQMISIHDYGNTIKDDKMAEEWLKLLTEKWQLSNSVQSVDPDITRAITNKCSGNPLLCLQYYIQLLQNGFIEIDKSGNISSHAKFKNCIRLNNFTEIPIPRIAFKLNCSFFDKCVQTIKDKGNKQRPDEVNQMMKGIAIMKAATVIGDEFELAPLMKIQPLRSETLQNIIKICHLLEQQDLIEILDASDPKNYKMRFAKAFLRETVYQIILYRDQKQKMHGGVAEYMQQEAPKQNLMNDPLLSTDVRIDVLKSHMMIYEDRQTEDQLPYNSRTGLTVKAIEAKIIKNPDGILWEGTLKKEGQGTVKNVEKRLVCLTSTTLRWYHDEDEKKRGEHLGSVPLTMIYQCHPSRMNSGADASAFSIGCAEWIDKKGISKGMRSFFYMALNVMQRDQWIAAIDYLRTMAISQQFTTQHTQFNFPLKEAELNDEEDEYDYEKKNLIYDFGKSLKQKSGGQSSSVVKTNNGRVVKPFARVSIISASRSDHSRTSNSRSPNNRQSLIQLEKSEKEDLAKKLKTLYAASFSSFFHHLKKTSIKVSLASREAKLGTLSESQAVDFKDECKKLGFVSDQMTSDNQSNFGPSRDTSPQPGNKQSIAGLKGRASVYSQQPIKQSQSLIKDNSERALPIKTKNETTVNIDIEKGVVAFHPDKQGSPKSDSSSDSEPKVTKNKLSMPAATHSRKPSHRDNPDSFVEDVTNILRQTPDPEDDQAMYDQQLHQGHRATGYFGSDGRPIGQKSSEESPIFDVPLGRKGRDTEPKPNRKVTGSIPTSINTTRTDHHKTVIKTIEEEGAYSGSQGQAKPTKKKKKKQGMMQGIEQMISQSIKESMSQIVQQNELRYEEQKQELARTMSGYQQSILNMTQSQGNFLSPEKAPAKMLDTSSVFSQYLVNLNQTDNKPKGISSKRTNEEQKQLDNPQSKFGDSDVPDEQEDFTPGPGYKNLVQRQDSVSTQDRARLTGMGGQYARTEAHTDNDLPRNNTAVRQPAGVNQNKYINLKFATDEEEGISQTTKKQHDNSYRSEVKRMSMEVQEKKRQVLIKQQLDAQQVRADMMAAQEMTHHVRQPQTAAQNQRRQILSSNSPVATQPRMSDQNQRGQSFGDLPNPNQLAPQMRAQVTNMNYVGSDRKRQNHSNQVPPVTSQAYREDDESGYTRTPETYVNKDSQRRHVNHKERMAVQVVQAQAICRTKCLAREPALFVPKGSVVDILQLIPEDAIMRCRYRGDECLFNIKDFKQLGANTADRTLDNLSPVAGDSGNGGSNFDPHTQAQYRHHEDRTILRKKSKKKTSRQ